MKALVFNGKDICYTEDYPRPLPQKTESLVKIHLAAICNTDKEILRGYRPDFKGIMGHEFVGEVVESPDRHLIGKRVVGELNAGCGHCIYCTTGREKHCNDRRVIGMEKKDGCFGEYMSIETHLLHEVPDALKDEEAIFTEPLAAAVEILSQIHIKPEQNVAVLGDGRLAYMIAQVISLTGVDLTIVGKHSEKLKKFEKLGTTCKDTGETFEIVIDATGSPTGIESAQKLVRNQGTIVQKSTYAGKAEVDLSLFAVHEVTLKGSRCGPFKPALNLLSRGYVSFPEIELYSLENYKAAFESKAFKVGFSVSR